MATFYKVDQNNSDAVYATDLIQINSLLVQLFAKLDIVAKRMDQMTTEQIGTLYGITGSETPVKTTIGDAFDVLNTNADLINLRTKLG